MRGSLTGILVVAAAILFAVLLHGLELAPDVRPAREPLPLIDEVVGWRHRHVDPESGLVEWEALGERAVPSGTTGARIERPRVVYYSRAGSTEEPRPLEAEAEVATATWPRGAETVIHFERRIEVHEAGWTFRTEELYLTIPPRRGSPASDDARARLETDRPVTLDMDDPEGSFRGSGLRASAETREATLLPPVSGRISAEALARLEGDEDEAEARRGEMLDIETTSPVVIREVAEGACDVILTGPATGNYRRAGEAEPFEGLLGGGVLHLRKPTKRGASSEAEKRPSGGISPDPPSAKKGARRVGKAAGSAEIEGGVEVRQAGLPVLLGEKLFWDASSGVATVLGAPGRPPELRRRQSGAIVTADTIRYLVRAGEVELVGGVRGAFSSPSSEAERARGLGGTWRIEAPRAVIALARGAAISAGPSGSGDLRTVTAIGARGSPVRLAHDEDDARGEARKAVYFAADERLELEAEEGGLARFSRGRSSLEARRIVWDRKAGEARVSGAVKASIEREIWGGKERLARAVTPAADPGGPEGAAIAASDWDIEADSLLLRFFPGSATVTAVAIEGRESPALFRSRPREAGTLPYEVRGASIRADRLAGTIDLVPLSGAASRQTLVRGRDRLEAREIHYDEGRALALARGEVVFTRAAAGNDPPLRAEAALVALRFFERRRPATIDVRGSADAPVLIVRGDRDRPVRLVAPRIEGAFDPETGRLASVSAEGEGGPVTLEPAAEVPEAERFRVLGGRIACDLESGKGEVFGLGNGPPRAFRGEKERLEAARVTFDLESRTVHLFGGVRGRFFASVPDPLGGLERAPGPALFDMESEEAIASLARGLETLEARGRVRFRDAEREVSAERALYDRGAGTVRLEGLPVEVRRGAEHESRNRVLTIRLMPEGATNKEER